LNESGGKRQLPIIIGGFEAQAIAIELEKMTPTRPLTHDLFKSFAIAFSIQVNEVIIYKLLEGIFYAKLVCEKDGFVTEIDARTSDAIAVGVRFNCPIYTFESILSGAGTLLTEGLDEVLDEQSTRSDTEDPISTLASHSIEELEEKLEEALDNEDYELASRIRDELNRRK
jgi:bifunctional DNase/RNase